MNLKELNKITDTQFPGEASARTLFEEKGKLNFDQLGNLVAVKTDQGILVTDKLGGFSWKTKEFSDWESMVEGLKEDPELDLYIIFENVSY